MNNRHQAAPGTDARYSGACGAPRCLSHDCVLAEETLQAVNGPVTSGRQRASGLRFADPKNHSLLLALVLFRQLANGFRSADLRQHLAALSARSPEAISQNGATYQLRRLSLRGLIEKVPRSFRYRVTDFGFPVALFYTRTYNRLRRPGLAAGCPYSAPLALRLNVPSTSSMPRSMPPSSKPDCRISLTPSNLTRLHSVIRLKLG